MLPLPSLTKLLHLSKTPFILDSVGVLTISALIDFSQSNLSCDIPSGRIATAGECIKAALNTPPLQ